MTEQITASPEALLTGEQILAGLREERWQNAEDLSSRAMNRALMEVDRINNPSVTLLEENLDFIPYTASLSPAEAIALEAVGVDPRGLAPKLEPTRNKLSRAAQPSPISDDGRKQKGSFSVAGAKLVVEQEPYETTTFSYRILSDDTAEKESFRSNLRDNVAAAFAERPAYNKVHQAIAESGEHPKALTVKLNIDEDPQGVLSVLSDVGLFRWNNAQIQAQILQGGITAKEAITRATEEIAQKNGVVSPDFIKAVYGEGVKHTVFLDSHSGDVTLSLEQEPTDFYVERANQWQEVSEAFIDTQCAKELFDALAEQGLTVSNGIHHELTRAGEAARFGSVYTQLTREIAKWIDRPARTKVSNILALQDTASTDKDTGLEVDQEDMLRDLLQKIQLENVSEPTRVLLTMMQEAVSRTALPSDLEVTKGQVHISKSACFDVTTYYIGGAVNGGVRKITEGNVPMLQKTHGGNTYMTLDSSVFNGVKIPKGSLLSKAEDGGWFFQRLTPFSFDNPSDIAVFGSEVAKTKDIEKRSIADLGGMSLARIVERVV